ncbi:MAG: hypothetical protein IPN24_04980 [Betaproteobacteria bacterium]|nr:hypothetical protein [Betaproteobacteria bacterium]
MPPLASHCAWLPSDWYGPGEPPVTGLTERTLPSGLLVDRRSGLFGSPPSWLTPMKSSLLLPMYPPRSVKSSESCLK